MSDERTRSDPAYFAQVDALEIARLRIAELEAALREEKNLVGQLRRWWEVAEAGEREPSEGERRCPNCNGTGHAYYGDESNRREATCGTCGGSGEVEFGRNQHDEMQYVLCPDCQPRSHPK